MAVNAAAGTPGIAVVGAGVIGLAIAFRLAREGRDVLLIDPREPGREASYGNAGHIATEQIVPLASPDTIRRVPALLLKPDSPLSVRREYAWQILPWLLRFAWASRPAAFQRGAEALAALQGEAMRSLRELCALAGIGSLLHERGHMLLVESPASLAAIDAQRRLFDEHNIESAWLAPDEVAAKAPELKRDIAGALRFTGSGHVTDPHLVCTGLHKAFTAAGGKTLKAAVREVRRGPGGGFQLATDSDTLAVGRLVIAAGAWSAPLAAQLGSAVPLDTERGYSVTVDGWRGPCDVAIASFERMTIMTPMERGLRITGFVEFGGLRLPPRPRRLAALKRHLRELLPSIDLAGASEWMGFRPSLPDHLPVIGRSAASPDAVLAFGHQHLGLTLAGITSSIVAALIGHRQAPLDPRPFRADRFRGKGIRGG